MKTKRNISIDRFRGLMVFGMIFFQLLSNFNSFGVIAQISKHAPDCFPKTLERIAEGFNGIYLLPNMTIADFVASAFLLAIGLTYIGSYNRKKEKYGKKKAFLMVITRYLIIAGIGVMFSAVNYLLDGTDNTGLLLFVTNGMLYITIAILVTGILNLIFKKFKFGKIMGKITKCLAISLGITGILFNLTNTVLECFAITETNYGFWGVLQHIGLSGVIVTIVVNCLKDNSTKKRAIVGVIIFVLYAIFHETALPTLKGNETIVNNMGIMENTADGGFFGGIGYASLMLLFTVFSDIYNKDKKEFRKKVLLLIIPVVVVITYAAITFTPWDGSNNLLTAGLSDHFSINKGSISPAYLIITLFSSLLLFLITDLFENKKLKFDFLDIWGRNPLLMYILEFGFIGGVTKLSGDAIIANAPLPLAILEVIILIGILTFIANKLYKKGSIIKL